MLKIARLLKVLCFVKSMSPQNLLDYVSTFKGSREITCLLQFSIGNLDYLFLHRSVCLCFLSADICIATAISLLMILICGMATYGAYKVDKQTIQMRFKQTCELEK